MTSASNIAVRLGRRVVSVAILAGFCALFSARGAAAPGPSPGLALEPCEIGGSNRPLRCGTYDVLEDRAAATGRTLPIRVILIPARSPDPRAEPILFLAGGPGDAATRSAAGLAASWLSENHHMLLIDHRGTGEGHRLDCELVGDDDNLQGYFDPVFEAGRDYAGCRETLSADHDLSQFSSDAAMRDVDEIRTALGFDKIYIVAGSYGTRDAVTYIAMFGDHVAGAQLAGAAPPANRNPLYHAPAAQHAFDRIVELCGEDPNCNAAYPDLRGDLAAILARLEAQPEPVEIAHPVTGDPVTIRLSADSFGEAMRTIMYRSANTPRIPLLVHGARNGNLAPFAAAGLASNRGIRSIVAFGLLLSVTCTEDVSRIDPAEIGPLTDDTFLGDQRVRGQIAACRNWPRTDFPATLTDPPASDVPVIIVSGDVDPVTPPRWGEEMARLFPNHLHLIAPGSHDVRNDCTDAITQALFAGNALDEIDTSCMDALERPAFVLPGDDSGS